MSEAFGFVDLVLVMIKSKAIKRMKDNGIVEGMG